MSLPSVFNVNHRVARKEHRCCECNGVISPLDVYERTEGCWDGKWDTFKTCPSCDDARDWLMEETDWRQILKYGGLDGDGALFYYGALRDHLLEQAREGHPRYRFRAYRLVVLMNRRRAAAKDAP